MLAERFDFGFQIILDIGVRLGLFSDLQSGDAIQLIVDFRSNRFPLLCRRLHLFLSRKLQIRQVPLCSCWGKCKTERFLEQTRRGFVQYVGLHNILDVRFQLSFHGPYDAVRGISSVGYNLIDRSVHQVLVQCGKLITCRAGLPQCRSNRINVVEFEKLIDDAPVWILFKIDSLIDASIDWLDVDGDVLLRRRVHKKCRHADGARHFRHT